MLSRRSDPGGLLPLPRFRAFNRYLVAFTVLLAAAALAVAALAVVSSRLGETQLRIPIIVAFAFALVSVLGALLRLAPEKEADSSEEPPSPGTDANDGTLAVRSEAEYAIAAVAAEGERALGLIREEFERLREELRTEQIPGTGAASPPRVDPDAGTSSAELEAKPERRPLRARDADVSRPESAGEDTQPSVDPGGPVETCSIHWWYGARKGGFEARVRRPDGSEYVLDRSSMSGGEDSGEAPPVRAIWAAYDELVERLQRAGWRQGEEGPAWYLSSFRRPLADGGDGEPAPPEDRRAR